MTAKTREKMIDEIIALEIEAKSYENLAAKPLYTNNNFPKYLKVIRKLQKLRNQL